MRPETMQKLALFQNEEEQANLQAAYRLVDPTVAADPAYPAGGSGPLWLLNSPEPAARSILEQAITKPLVIVQGITMLKENPEQAAQVLGPDFQERLAALLLIWICLPRWKKCQPRYAAQCSPKPESSSICLRAPCSTNLPFVP